MNIFQDLQIDYSNMMSDPQDFHSQCVNAAEKLKDILKADISVEHILKTTLENESPTPEQTAKIKHFITLDYEEADETMSVVEIMEYSAQLKKLAKDLEFLARDKVMLEMSKNDETNIDKSLAFDLYKELRERHNAWVDGMEMLSGFDENINTAMTDIEKLPSMPGNYGKGPQTLVHYIFRFGDEDDVYRIHHSVLRRLEKEGHVIDTHMNLMDAVDYLRANPELKVSITERAD
jgi:hypothetical protein